LAPIVICIKQFRSFSNLSLSARVPCSHFLTEFDIPFVAEKVERGQVTSGQI
jgi:hypothetical protein